jgi:hypothetical protein
MVAQPLRSRAEIGATVIYVTAYQLLSLSLLRKNPQSDAFLKQLARVCQVHHFGGTQHGEQKLTKNKLAKIRKRRKKESQPKSEKGKRKYYVKVVIVP